MEYPQLFPDNSAFPYPMDESFSPFYNSNFAWNPEIYFEPQNFTPYPTQNFSWDNSVTFNPQQNFQQPNLPYQFQSPHPQAVNNTSLDIGHDEYPNALEKSLEILIKTSTQITSQLSNTLNSYMQFSEHVLSSNTQVMARLETNFDQMANALSEGAKDNLPSQSVVNHEDIEEIFDEEISEEADQIFQNEENTSETTCEEICHEELEFLNSDLTLKDKETELDACFSNTTFEELFYDELRFLKQQPEIFDGEFSEEADQVFQNEENVSEITCGEIFLDEPRFLNNNQQLNFYTSTMTPEFEEILKELVAKEHIFTNQEFKFTLHNTNNTYPTLLLNLLNALECSEFKYIIDFIILKLFKIRGRIFSNKVGFNVEYELLMIYLLFYISIFFYSPLL